MSTPLVCTLCSIALSETARPQTFLGHVPLCLCETCGSQLANVSNEQAELRQRSMLQLWADLAPNRRIKEH